MLKNKVIVLTGGAGFLGKEFAKHILVNNGILIIADYNEEEGRVVTEKLAKSFLSNQVSFYKLDINNKLNVESLIAYLNKKYQRIDALINNAYPRNKNYGKKFEDVEYEDFCENLNINLGGYFLTSQQFLKYFNNQGYGNLINISSIYGVVAPKFEIYSGTEMTMPIEYSAIKSALIHITKYIAKYYKGKNIRANAISLGGVLDQQPSQFIEQYNKHCCNKGMLDGKDIAGTLIYMLSDLSTYLNGQNIVVDDGFTL